MDATTLLKNLRTLLNKQETPTPSEIIAKAGEQLGAIALTIKEGEDAPKSLPVDLRAIAAALTSLANASEPTSPAEKVDVTKAELDAYTAARTTMGGLYDLQYGMSDALRAMDMDKFSKYAGLMQAACQTLVSLAGEAIGGAPAEGAPAEGATETTANEKGDATMTRDEFIAWAVAQIEATKKDDTVEKAEKRLAAITKAVLLAKEAFISDGNVQVAIPTEILEAYPGTSIGGKKMDLTVNADQSVTTGDAFKATPGGGDSAFATNADAVLKALEELLRGAPAAPVAKSAPAAEEFAWPNDMNRVIADDDAAEREKLAKQAAADKPEWGNDPWKAAPSFPQVR